MAFKIAMSCLGPGEMTIKSGGKELSSATCDALYTNNALVPAGLADLGALSIVASPKTKWRIAIYLPTSV